MKKPKVVYKGDGGSGELIETITVDGKEICKVSELDEHIQPMDCASEVLQHLACLGVIDYYEE